MQHSKHERNLVYGNCVIWPSFSHKEEIAVKETVRLLTSSRSGTESASANASSELPLVPVAPSP